MKQRITKFSNWLLENGFKELNEVKSSNSRYFKKGTTVIRVSDHMPVEEGLSSGAISIVFPTNKLDVVGVFHHKAFIPMKTIKDVKTFISNLLLIKNIHIAITCSIAYQNKVKDLKKEVTKLQSVCKRYKDQLNGKNK